MRKNSYSFATLFFIAIAFFAIINTSCNKSDEILNSSSPIETFTVEQKNTNIELLGQVFATLSKESKDFRLLVWEKAQEKVTHDYDVPIVFILDEVIGKTTVRESANLILNKIAPNSNLEQLLASLHYVQLTIPLHQVDAWNPVIVPSIAVVPVMRNQEESETYVGFNSNGEKIQFSAVEAPEEPVIVVRESDRIDKKGNLIVNMHGLIVPEEARLHINEFRENIKELIRMREDVNAKGERFFNVISEATYLQIEKEQKAEQESLQKRRSAEQKLFLETFAKANAVKNLVSNNLTGFTNQSKAVSLSWTAIPQSGTIYRVYASGLFIVNGSQQFVTKQLLSTTTSLNATCIIPCEGEVYNIWVEGFNNSTGVQISCSNFFEIHSSGRASGCKEYPSRIFMTASAMRDLEGWAANDLELYWKITHSSTTGTAITPEQEEGGKTFYPHYSWGRMQDTERNFSATSFPLFNWSKSSFINNGQYCNNGVYSIFWYEHDGDRKDKTIQIATKIVKLLVSTYSQMPLLTEAIFSMANHVFDMDERNENIGTCHIEWWSLKDKRVLPRSGIAIDFSYNN